MFVVEQASSQGGREINCTCTSSVQHHVEHHVGLLNNGSDNFEFTHVVLKRSESAWHTLQVSRFCRETHGLQDSRTSSSETLTVNRFTS